MVGVGQSMNRLRYSHQVGDAERNEPMSELLVLVVLPTQHRGYVRVEIHLGGAACVQANDI